VITVQVTLQREGALPLRLDKPSSYASIAQRIENTRGESPDVLVLFVVWGHSHRYCTGVTSNWCPVQSVRSNWFYRLVEFDRIRSDSIDPGSQESNDPGILEFRIGRIRSDSIELDRRVQESRDPGIQRRRIQESRDPGISIELDRRIQGSGNPGIQGPKDPGCPESRIGRIGFHCSRLDQIAIIDWSSSIEFDKI